MTLLKAYAGPFPTEESRTGIWIFPGEIRRSVSWLAETESRLGLLKEKPVVMIWAKKDPAFAKPKYINRWLRHFPQAELEILEDASHYLHEDRPDRIIAGIRKILGRVK